MSTIYFLQYNNYYNRIVKKDETIEDYLGNSNNYFIKEGVNFNFNDGVNSNLTINWTQSWFPDYALVVNETITRWFVIENTKIRGEQYKITLRRDVVADNIEEILDADCFIEKATLSDDNPLIFNKESITVNQIKTNEYELTDDTETSWLVGYFGETSDGTSDVLLNVSFQDDLNYDYSVNSSFANWEFKNGMYAVSEFKLYTSLNSLDINNTPVYHLKFDENGNISGTSGTYQASTRNDATAYLRKKVNALPADIATSNILASYKNTSYGVSERPTTLEFQDRMKSVLPGTVSLLHSMTDFSGYDYVVNNLYKYNNKRVKFINTNGTAEYYLINITEETVEPKWFYANKDTSNTPLYFKLFNGAFDIYANASAGQTYFYVGLTRKKININATLIPSGITSLEIHKGRNKLKDAPYRMFCMPYKSSGTKRLSISNTGSGITAIQQSASLSLQVANELNKKYSGTGQIYDIQILPYLPIFGITDANGNIDIKNNTDMYDVIYKQDSSSSAKTPVGYVLYPEYSSFTLNIPFDKYNLSNVKMTNETEMMRLVSPNYSSQFEFNPAKNGGITFFNVDCTYKPYNPYIHVNPNFGLLYGSDFNDSRGLICSGDFSITSLSDAFKTYELQNKNYNEIFNREIQNLELNQSVERKQDIINSIVGGLSGAGAGAFLGSMVGGPAGLAAGAIGGLAASGGAGLYDYSIKESLRNEALDYKRDMFNFQLGNIRAMPQTITRSTSMTYNNKIFPILEYYTCTEEEKRAVANKIAYNGMTVMAIGKLRGYIGNNWEYNGIKSKGYIKGSIIRIENISEDTHYFNAIADEIFKGVYYDTRRN